MNIIPPANHKKMFGLLWLVGVVMLSGPFKRETIRAIPENLSTYTPGGWHGEVTSHEVLAFERSNFGLIGSFITIDRGIGHSHWSVSVDPVMLAIYVAGGCAAALLVLPLCGRWFQP